jgi:hypothetical protein
MRNIDAVQNKDDGFALFESDRIWLVGKSLGDDFNSPGGLRVAYRYAPGEKNECQEYYGFGRHLFRFSSCKLKIET